jgi:acyl-CoA hydrolase
MSDLPPSGEPAIRTIFGWLISQMDLAGGSAASRRASKGLKIGSFDIVELNEAFARQSLVVLRSRGCPTMKST